jgi:hypothetical protein
MRTVYRKWSQIPYPGELTPPGGNPAPGYWPMFFISRQGSNVFLDPEHQPITWRIKNPNDIDWNLELLLVEQTLMSITPEQVRSAQYWGSVDITRRISDIALNLNDKYILPSPNAARVLGYLQAAINDTFVITWYLKYLWDAARPGQYDPNLPTVLTTPRFPGYPSAHAAAAGCMETILSYFFPAEALRLNIIAQQSAMSRLYAGVHFKVDNDEGLRLGRQIGEMFVKLLMSQSPGI